MESENTMQRTVVASKVKDAVDAVDAMVDLIFGDRVIGSVVGGELVDVSAW
jgi:hypothetical protein